MNGPRPPWITENILPLSSYWLSRHNYCGTWWLWIRSPFCNSLVRDVTDLKSLKKNKSYEIHSSICYWSPCTFVVYFSLKSWFACTLLCDSLVEHMLRLWFEGFSYRDILVFFTWSWPWLEGFGKHLVDVACCRHSEYREYQIMHISLKKSLVLPETWVWFPRGTVIITMCILVMTTLNTITDCV